MSDSLHDLMDCSLPGSSVHGIFQTRVLEWGAIAFSTVSLYLYVYRERMRESVFWGSGDVRPGWISGLMGTSNCYVLIPGSMKDGV